MSKASPLMVVFPLIVVMVALLAPTGCLRGQTPADSDSLETVADTGRLEEPGVYRILLDLQGTTGEQRGYLVLRPDGEPPASGWPLVLVFHGGGGLAETAMDHSAWPSLARDEGFVVVFPQGTRPDPTKPARFGRNGSTWNDGSQRESLGAIARGEEDLQYVDALVDDLARRLELDRDRLFATGFSNGGSMSLLLGRARSEVFAAVAAVGSTDPIDDPPAPAASLSVLYITGTEDPMNPMEGGEVFLGRRFYGSSRPVEEVLRGWATGLGCADAGAESRLSEDAVLRVYQECADHQELRYIRLIGHGHHWPGAESLLPERMAGPNTSGLDATQVIWEFFSTK